VRLAPRDLEDLQDTLDSLALPATLAILVWSELLDLPDIGVTQEQLVQQVILVTLVQPVSQVQLAPSVIQVPRVPLEIQVSPDPLGIPDSLG